MKTRNRNIRLLALLLCVLLTVSGCTLFKSGKYQKAVELFEQGQYLDAQGWFLKIKEYEDSGMYLDYILAWDTAMNGELERAAEMYAALGDFRDSAAQSLACRYGYAEQLLTNGQYDEAAAVFAALGDYQDAAQRVLQTYYAKAEDLVAKGMPEEAISVFADISGYADAAQRIPGLHYDAALQKMALGDYESACAHFEAAEGYQNTQTFLDAEAWFAAGKYDLAIKKYEKLKDVPGTELRITMIKYAKADNYDQNGQFVNAGDLFREIDGYADAHERASQCFYIQAEKSVEGGNIDSAAIHFEKAGDYRDAAERAKQCYYQSAEKHFENSDYQSAAEAFVKAGDHRDAFERAVGIKRLLLTKGKPIKFSTANELKNQQQATCHGVYLQYDIEQEKYRFTIDITVPAGYRIVAFNPPQGSKFMRRIGTTTGERQEVVFNLEAEKLDSVEEITINCVKSDKNRFFVFLQKRNFITKTPAK